MTKPEAARCFAALAAGFPTVKLGAATVDLYMGKLQTWELELGMQAVRQVLETCPRWPALAELVGAYRSLERGRAVKLAAERGLAEPDPSPEQREEFRRKLAALAANIGKGIDEAELERRVADA